MFYWVIPYLVGYNVSLQSADWKKGPIHTFEAEVNAKVVKDSTEVNSHSDITMLFECRPINSSFIKCQVQNASLQNYEMVGNNKTSVEPENKWAFFEDIGAIDFHIEFDRTGVKNLTFSKPRGYFREMMIRTIFHNLNIGIDLTDKNFDRYNAIDKSVYGDCPTNFNIIKVPKLSEKKEFLVQRDAAVKKLMIVPFLDKFSEDQTIAIGKESKMTKCLNKKSYIFGSDELTALNRKEGFVRESNIIDLQSEIYLGTNRFFSMSRHSGTFKAGFQSENSKNHGSKMMVGKTSEKIRLTLVSVLPDKS